MKIRRNTHMHTHTYLWKNTAAFIKEKKGLKLRV